jgi:hypothetical protein
MRREGRGGEEGRDEILFPPLCRQVTARVCLEKRGREKREKREEY